MHSSDLAHRTAEDAVRTSYGRLLAYLAARSRDIAAAEDALGEALYQALRTWPERGVPDKPEAWLLTVARNHLIRQARHNLIRAAASAGLIRAAEEAQKVAQMQFPDERLKLLFICAHPAIDAKVRAPLMLQTVLGLDAARMAPAFLVSPATMSQRLVRAKAKIAQAGIAFEVPEDRDLPPRLADVLDAIYAAFGTAWEHVAGGQERWRELTAEAIWLARLVVGLLPSEPEARGLLALLLHCEARRAARRRPNGEFVCLSGQETQLWDSAMIREAEQELAQASACGRPPGPFQLEAAIQSAHASRALTGVTPWEAIAILYEGLACLSPTLAVMVGRAAAGGEAFGADYGLNLLNQLDPESSSDYQPFWALRAHLLKRIGGPGAAAEAYRRAIGLSHDPTVREFLQRQAE